MQLPSQCLIVPRQFISSFPHIYIQIFHPCQYEQILLKNNGVKSTRFSQCFIKMWLLWQHLVVHKLYLLCAHLHICVVHLCKHKQSLLKNIVFCTRLFSVFIKKWLPWHCLIASKLNHLYAHIHIHTFYACNYVTNKFVKKQRSCYLHTYLLIEIQLDGQTDDKCHNIILPLSV